MDWAEAIRTLVVRTTNPAWNKYLEPAVGEQVVDFVLNGGDAAVLGQVELALV